MPVEEGGRLNDDRLRENFVERVFVYDDWCRLCEREGGLTAKALIEFHSRTNSSCWPIARPPTGGSGRCWRISRRGR